jgi:hypothetical protein
MNFTVINKDNIGIIHDFLKTTSSKHFRYYNKRKPEDVINQHKYTIVGTVDNQPVSYGHIDYCDNKYWLGLCVSDNQQNKKHGTSILYCLFEWCLENDINNLYLSVDIDNSIAIHLYTKNGFVINDNRDGVIYMRKLVSKTNTIKLDTSYGEALDKLSILEIKMDRIKDERRNDVATEYELLHKQLINIFNNDIDYFYRILKSINNDIWIKQDIYRSSNDKEERNKLCDEIIHDNDRRFRVKAKINNILNSNIKEQKGYVKKKAFVLTHLGLGDMVNCIGMIRFLSTMYDEVVIVCRRIFYNNIKMLFDNDKTIKYHLCNDFQEISPIIPHNIHNLLEITQGYHLYLCGAMNKIYELQSKNGINITSEFNHVLPFCFYGDCGLSPHIYREYSYIPRIYESMKLYNEVKNICENYIIIHENCSLGKLFTFDEIIKNIDINETLVINTDTNMYNKGHKYYEIAEKCVSKPILYYVDLIENSYMNLFSDSCIFCLALQLNIKTVNNYYVGRGSYMFFDERFGFDKTKHPLFTILKEVKVI